MPIYERIHSRAQLSLVIGTKNKCLNYCWLLISQNQNTDELLDSWGCCQTLNIIDWFNCGVFLQLHTFLVWAVYWCWRVCLQHTDTTGFNIRCGDRSLDWCVKMLESVCYAVRTWPRFGDKSNAKVLGIRASVLVKCWCKLLSDRDWSPNLRSWWDQSLPTATAPCHYIIIEYRMIWLYVNIFNLKKSTLHCSPTPTFTLLRYVSTAGS